MALGAGGGVQIDGLRDFRRTLKTLDQDLPKQLREIHKRGAELMAEVANAAVPMSAAGSIKARATQTMGRVEFNAGRRGDALAQIWGARRKTGWYRRVKYRPSEGRQFEPFVGVSWQVGDPAGQPYFVGAPMNAAVDDLMELYGDEIEKFAREAFPN